MALSASSCSQKIDIQESDTSITLETKSSSPIHNYVYNSSTKTWMIEQEDPYEISHIRSLAKNQSEIDQVSATHYALKLYPRNEKELNEIIRMEGITVSYIPFGFTYAPVSSANYPLTSITNSTRIYQEEEKYYIQNEDNANSIPLPVLYVAWPVSKPLPTHYEYSIEYEACLPNSDSDSTAETNEGITIANSLRGTSHRTVTGYIKDYDDLINTYVSLKRVKVRLSYGLSSLETTTSEGGYFSITGNINDDATLQIVYENDQFRITNGGLSTYVASFGTVLYYWGTYNYVINSAIIYTNSSFQAVYRGAYYFFNGNHSINTPASSYSLRISMDSFSSTWSGCFNYYPIVPPYININIRSSYDDADYVGNVLHELGHFNHYQNNGGFSDYSGVPLLIRESYAVFVSWRLSRQYYTNLNSGVYDSSWDSRLATGYQYWSGSGEYSPLFVDLVDDYNQNYYISENVSGVPVITIVNYVKDKQNWAALRSPLKNYLSSHFPSEVNAYLAPYDTYFGYSGN